MKPVAESGRQHLSDMFPIKNGVKQGDALLPLLFNSAVEYAITRVQVNQEGMKLNGTDQLQVYADVNILGGRVHTIQKNTQTLVATSKEIGLEVDTDKTKYVVVPQDQNARLSHNIKSDNKSSERVEPFQYVGKP